jgi:hypothetical protein
VVKVYIITLSRSRGDIPPTDGKGFKEILQELDEFCFTTEKRKLWKSTDVCVPDFIMTWQNKHQSPRGGSTKRHPPGEVPPGLL